MEDHTYVLPHKRETRHQIKEKDQISEDGTNASENQHCLFQVERTPVEEHSENT